MYAVARTYDSVSMSRCLVTILAGQITQIGHEGGQEGGHEGEGGAPALR